MEASISTPSSKRLWDRFGIVGLLIVAILIGIVVFYIISPLKTTATLASAMRQSIPLVLGALCGLLGERTGVINIGIEGQMLMGAFIAFLANVYTGNLIVAVAAGILPSWP
jgi:simple sugar transport system permease protein